MKGYRLNKRISNPKHFISLKADSLLLPRLSVEELLPSRKINLSRNNIFVIVVLRTVPNEGYLFQTWLTTLLCKSSFSVVSLEWKEYICPTFGSHNLLNCPLPSFVCVNNPIWNNSLAVERKLISFILVIVGKISYFSKQMVYIAIN